ncbi:hypothetical protein OCU04_011962 [Sclerotinia nivalis]|uniref:Uncharacterized protein n=1 Tax=Sclerotinia nivalis TaxID=352851 RepID=A0A9X0A9Y5_9HELO|nr:hypothetical protein OCU04_011962 [Sclerotinia nivalis]
MNRISPQLINKTYQSIKLLASLTGAAQSIEIPKMLTHRSITARRTFNSASNKEKIFRQCYSRNYSKPSFIHTEHKPTTPTPAKSPTVTSETQKLQDNSHITTRSHVYYETYRIAGFHPSVYNVLPQPKPAKKPPNADLEAKKTVAEYTCHITTYNHAYYKEFSIAGFHPVRTTAPAQPKHANEPATEPTDEPAKRPTSEPTDESTSMDAEISRAKALAIATAYTPSVSVQKRKTNQEYLDLDHDMEICAQTIEELGFETLEITGFQGTHDETEEGELKTEVEDGKVDDGKVDEQPVQSREGGEGPVRTGLSVICLFMGLLVGFPVRG